MPSLPTSRRGQRNVKPDLMIDLSRRVADDAYNKKSNPGGIVDLGSSVNEMMLADLVRWQKKHETAEDRRKYLTYNDTQCSPELPAAAASFINHFFSPSVPLAPGSMLAANGLTALLDTLFFNLADPGSAVLVPAPGYGMFGHDLTARNGLHVVPVPCDDITAARFRQHVRPGRPRPELLDRLSAAAGAQRALGRRVAAVLVANPENPLGCCYTRETLRWLVRWCAEEGAHLVADEVYALGGGEAFTSVLSLELGGMRENVHVLWGMSKDFGLGGCRVGFLATYNEQLYQAMRTCSMFTWVSAFGGLVSAKLLSDLDFVSRTYLPKYRQVLSDRRTYVKAVLARLRIPYTDPDAAFFVFLDLSSWLPNFDGDNGAERELALLEYLIDRRVFLEPGRAFMATFPGHFRLNYGAEEAVLRLGLERLTSALSELGGEKGGSGAQEVPASRRQSIRRTLFCCFESQN